MNNYISPKLDEYHEHAEVFERKWKLNNMGCDVTSKEFKEGVKYGNMAGRNDKANSGTRQGNR